MPTFKITVEKDGENADIIETTGFIAARNILAEGLRSLE